jgi:hypothetical protein
MAFDEKFKADGYKIPELCLYTFTQANEGAKPEKGLIQLISLCAFAGIYFCRHCLVALSNCSR